MEMSTFSRLRELLIFYLSFPSAPFLAVLVFLSF